MHTRKIRYFCRVKVVVFIINFDRWKINIFFSTSWGYLPKLKSKKSCLQVGVPGNSLRSVSGWWSSGTYLARKCLDQSSPHNTVISAKSLHKSPLRSQAGCKTSSFRGTAPVFSLFILLPFTTWNNPTTSKISYWDDLCDSTLVWDHNFWPPLSLPEHDFRIRSKPYTFLT